MSNEFVRVPPGHKVVVIHPSSLPQMGVTESKLVVLDFGSSGDWRTMLAKVETGLLGGAFPTTITILQMAMIDSLVTAGEQRVVCWALGVRQDCSQPSSDARSLMAVVRSCAVVVRTCPATGCGSGKLPHQVNSDGEVPGGRTQAARINFSTSVAVDCRPNSSTVPERFLPSVSVSCQWSYRYCLKTHAEMQDVKQRL